MKKRVWHIIAFVFLLVMIVSGATYAFFMGSFSSANNVNTSSKDFQIEYYGDTALNGNLYMTSGKTDDYKRTVRVRTVGANSVDTKLNLYIDIAEISPALSVEGFVWEVYGYQNNTQVFRNSGTFAGKSATQGSNIVDLVDFTNHTYTVNNTETTFDVYLWLDGSKVNESIVGSVFRGTIAARSENFTGIPK